MSDPIERLKRQANGLMSEAEASAEEVIKKPSRKATHAFSTSLRRLSTLRKVTRRLFGEPVLRGPKHEFKMLRRRVGDLRDAQELIRLADALEGGRETPAFQAFRRDLLGSKRSAASALVGHLEKGGLAMRLGFPGPRALSVFFARSLACDVADFEAWLKDQVHDATPRPVRGASPDDLHGLRIRIKEFRYASEMLAGPNAEAIEPLKALQTSLGEAHDAAVLLERFDAFLEAEGGIERLEGGAALRRILARRARARHLAAARSVCESAELKGKHAE